jgi:Rrf2 family protein
MLLNLTAAYGLRAVATLAGLAPGESLNSIQLSERTRVPRQYLSKVMRKLVLAKLVRARRGRGGGFSLNRPALAISVADVLRAIDVEPDMGCAFGYSECDQQNPCPLHPIWSRLQASLEHWTSGSTLADLADRPAAAPVRGTRSR